MNWSMFRQSVASLGVAVRGCAGGAVRFAFTVPPQPANAAAASRQGRAERAMGGSLTGYLRRVRRGAAQWVSGPMRLPTIATALLLAAAGPAAAAGPLAGKTIAVDPGHNGGNYLHTAEIDRIVDAGALRKACDTTGTATDDGYSEA